MGGQVNKLSGMPSSGIGKPRMPEAQDISKPWDMLGKPRMPDVQDISKLWGMLGDIRPPAGVRPLNGVMMRGMDDNIRRPQALGHDGVNNFDGSRIADVGVRPRPSLLTANVRSRQM